MGQDTNDAGPKAPPDWERIEIEYRAGILSLREIAAAHGITHGAVNKRAKRDGWTRDLNARIQAKADELVSKQAVSEEVSKAKLATERVLIEANAQVIAGIRSAHRVDIGRARRLCMALLEELEAQTADVPALVNLGELMRQDNDVGVDRLNDIYRSIISLPERTKTLKALAESLKHLVSIERDAYGIVSGASAEDKPVPQRVSVTVEDASMPEDA